jgi:Family of unknown function (DUF6493)
MTMTEITEEELRASIFAGDPQSTFTLLEPHPTAELKRFQKMLGRIRTEQQQMERTDWNGSRVLGGTLVIAGVLCSDTPAQAADWLGRRRLFDCYIDKTPNPQGILVRRHDTAWLADLALRLGGKLRQDDDAGYWHFVDNLADHSGAALPLSPAYVRGWLQAVGNERWEAEQRGERFTLTDWLREQPRLRECIEALFATDNTGVEFVEYPGYKRPEEARWPQAFATLTAEGVLDRAELLDSCAARLLRGDKPGSVRGVLDVFGKLAPTRAEVRERLSTYRGMAARSTGIVAKMALRELRALDAEEPFEPMDLASLSEEILARPENGIATAQLAWLEAAVKRDPGARGVLLPCFGTAFTHPATPVQQRALKLLRKHLKAADAETVPGLRDAALNVDPALKADAEALFAAFVDPAPADDAAPARALPAYQPTALPPMPGTPEELVTALAPSYSRGETAPLEAEQIMAAVAILSHRDRAGLAEVFRPLYERHGDADRWLYPWQLCWFPGALRCLLDAVLGKDHRTERFHVGDTSDTLPKASSIFLRIQELTEELLRGDTVPVLLATPTEASGAIDPAVLENRLVVYRTLGIKPLPLDLAHAKLRVAGGAGAVQAEARKEPREKASSTNAGSGRARPQIAPTFKAVLPLPGLVESGSAGLPQPSLWSLRKGQFGFLPIMLPYDPDLVAAASMVDLFHEANGMGSGAGAPGVFPSLAETAGVPGQLTHLALVYALAADKVEQRIAAQDAVLTFASRGLLKPEQLGRLAVACWQRDTVRGKRLIEALVQLEESGASAEIFWTVATMLGPLSKTPEIRGLPEVLLLATRAAVSAGMSGVRDEEVPGLAELAAVPKPKRVGAEARRLREAIAPAA